MDNCVLNTNLENLKPFQKGKVRDVYELNSEHLLIVSTDRISAFDVILPDPIPDKGKVLNSLASFWFKEIKDIVPNHFITDEFSAFPENLKDFKGLLKGRSMIVQKAQPIKIECVVRGYLAGSAWKEYQTSGAVCGVKLPGGLRESEKLLTPIFTPATKASETEHDLNITEEDVKKMLGEELTLELKKKSLEIFERAEGFLEARGLILADTKFEFGMINDNLVLIDEILTPDSSRFWDASFYEPGKSQENFDKQFVRDYLEKINWNKKPPAPQLPPEIIEQTRQRYVLAYQKIIGKEFVSNNHKVLEKVTT